MGEVRFWLGLCPRPGRGAHSAPPGALAGYKGPTSKEKGGEGRGQEEGEGKWREGRERWMGRGNGGEGKGPSPPNAETACRLCIDVWLSAATPPKLWEKLEMFELSEILGCRCRTETFMTYLYKKRTLHYCRNVLCVLSTIAPSSVKQCLPVLVELVLSL